MMLLRPPNHKANMMLSKQSDHDINFLSLVSVYHHLGQPNPWIISSLPCYFLRLTHTPSAVPPRPTCLKNSQRLQCSPLPKPIF